MFIPIWVLALAGAAAVAALTIALLVLRRALNELFFWRGAYVYTNDRVEELIEETARTSTNAREPARRSRTHVLANGEEAPAGRQAPSPDPSAAARTLALRYGEVIDSVSREASKRHIDWSSDADRDHYRQLTDG